MMSGNGAEKTRLDGLNRFLGLVGMQRRGDSKREPAEAPKPSPQELDDLAIATMLRHDEGGDVLIRRVSERIAEAMEGAQMNYREHAVCVGFLGAHAALKRLYDDLVRLRG